MKQLDRKPGKVVVMKGEMTMQDRLPQQPHRMNPVTCLTIPT